MGYPSHGTDSAWDDPAIGYVEQVEYSTSGGLSVQFLGAEAQMAILQAQIASGSLPRSTNKSTNKMRNA